MKYKVELYVSGSIFNFFCFASSTFDAEKVALQQYPNARIIHSTAVYR